MLPRVDRALAVVSWIAAGVLVLMLFIGPQVIAEDEAQPSPEAAAGAGPYGGGDGTADGKAVFSESCGSCHTLSAAGTSGQVGPDLNETSLDAGEIEEIVRGGRGGMPAFGGELSDAEIAAVAKYVADAGTP
jgi:mono/diheme cytochrome c family protein